MRVAALAAVLAQSIVMVRYLELHEIGQYYLIATVGYLGNAAVYVGADLNLQRRLAKVVRRGPVSARGLAAYVGFTGWIGMVLVLAAASTFYLTQADSSVVRPLICVGLSLAMYLSAVTRNLLQLADKPQRAAITNVLESVGKLALIAVAIHLGGASANAAALASLAGSLLAAGVGAWLLRPVVQGGTNASYSDDPRQLLHRIAPVGSSGLLNWAQLQGYRPLMISTAGAAEAVGLVAFLTTLGSTAANATFATLGQMQIPTQYATRGGSSLSYLRLAAACTLGVALLALPAGLLFLWLTGRSNLSPFVYLTVVGVLVESGNAFIGIATNHANALGHSLWHLPMCAMAGAALTAAILIAPLSGHGLHVQIAAALLSGQGLSATLSLYFSFRQRPSC